MSTYYYSLKEPFTSIRPEVLGGHTHVGIWVNHAKAGTLVFRNEEWANAIWVFMDEGNPRAHTSLGGEKTGMVVEEYSELQPEDQLINDRGEILMVSEIRQLAGK